MISNPTSKGKSSEARILADLTAAGKSVLVPWGEERFDLVIYNESGSFTRVQVKTGCLKDGYVLFRTVSVCSNGRVRHRYDGQLTRSRFTAQNSTSLILCPPRAYPMRWLRSESHLRETDNQAGSAGQLTSNLDELLPNRTSQRRDALPLRHFRLLNNPNEIQPHRQGQNDRGDHPGHAGSSRQFLGSSRQFLGSSR